MPKGIAGSFIVGFALLFAGGLISSLVAENNPGCFNCGAGEGMAVWLTGIAAHQSVAWTTSLRSLQRLVIWIVACIAAAAVYFLLDALASPVIAAGHLEAGIFVRGARGVTGALAAFLAGKILLTRLQIAHQLLFSVVTFFLAAVSTAYLTEAARVIDQKFALGFFITAYAPVLYLVWRPDTLRPYVSRLAEWFRIEWRFVPFYAAAVLVSIAALRYILSD